MTDLDTFRDQLKKFHDVADEYADNELSKLRSKAEKKIRDVDKRLENLGEDSTEFEENITEETNVMDKYSQKIYEQVQKTLENVQTVERVSLRNLQKYVSSIREGLAEQDKVLVKYIKLLKDRKYKSRVKTLDKSLSRLLKDLRSLEEFIKVEYAPSASVEDAATEIEEVEEKIDDFVDKLDELKKHENEVMEKQQDLSKIEEELDSLKHHPTLESYTKARSEYENTQRDVDYAFSNVRKVFRKYDKYMSKNRKNTNSQLLSELVTDAASALASQASVGSIESLLREINEALDDTALNLARDKRENAQEDIRKFLDGQLNEYYQKSKSVVETKERLEKELEGLKLDNKIETVERDMAAAQRDLKRIYQRELRSLEDIREDIEKSVESINKQFQRISPDTGSIKSYLPGYPSWIESDQ